MDQTSDVDAGGWGINPSSFEAVGTVAASFAAVVAIYLTRSQAKRIEEERRSEQARLITVGVLRKSGGGRGHAHTVQVHNASRAPVYGPFLIYRVDANGLDEAARTFQSPGRVSSTSGVPWKGFDIVAGIDTWPDELPPGSTSLEFEISAPVSKSDTAVCFTDSRRISKWSLSLDGTLREGATLGEKRTDWSRLFQTLAEERHEKRADKARRRSTHEESSSGL